MRRVLLIPSIALLILFAACFLISAGPFTGTSPTSRPITFLLLDDIKTLDSGQMSWANDLRAAEALWDGLTTYDINDNLKPVPAGAASWEISADGKLYTFHLRPNARWSNGDPVTAEDYLFAWRRVLNPSTGADYISLFDHIEGANAYTDALDKYESARQEYEKQSTAGNHGGVEAPAPPDPAMFRAEKIDDLTLVVHLNAPCTFFLDLLAMPPFFPLNAKSMEPFLLDKSDPLKGYDASYTRPPHLVSNGAFMLTDWKFKQHLLLEPNPHYWDRENVKCPQLIIQSVPDGRTALLMYQTGTADVLSFIPPDSADVMLQQKEREGKWPELHPSGVFGDYYYVFNCTRKPFDDKRVRKALAMAIDRKEIVHILNTGQKAMGLIIPNEGAIVGYTSPPELPYDPEAARKLLAEAGYPGGEGMKAIELLYNTESFHSKIAQAMGQMWQRNLGVKVSYRGLERGSFGSARAKDHDFDLARGGWDGDYPDPTTWLDLLRTPNGNNDGKFSSKAFDDLMAASDVEPDKVKRFAMLTKAEDLLVNDEVPLLPIYQRADGMLYDASKIQGAEMNVRMITELKWIRRIGKP